MSKKEKLEATAEEKLIGKISDFATSKKKGIVACAIALVALLVIAVVLLAVLSGSSDKKMDKLVELDNRYEEIYLENATSESATRVEDYTALAEDYEKLAGGKGYVAAKAEYQAGICYFRLGEYAKAYDAFGKAADMAKKYYLSSLALMNKAVCAEATDKIDEAKQIYDQITNLKDENGLAPKALFNLGRISYQEGNTELAKTYFTECAETYPDSEYGRLSINLKSVL